MTIPANNANMLEQLAECKAVLVSRNSFVASGFKRLRRCWPDALREYMDDYEAYLLAYASAKNGSTASTTVDGPMVDGKVLAGIWTCAAVTQDYAEMDPAVPGRQPIFTVIQDLVRGTYTGSYAKSEDNCEYYVDRYYVTGASAPITCPDKTSGVNYAVVGLNFNDETGTWSGWVERITAREQSGSRYVSSADETLAETLNTQAASQLTAPTASAGTIREVQSTPNRFCKYRTTDTTRTAVDQTQTDTNANAGETSVTEVHTQAAAVITASPTDGQTEEVENTPTPFMSRWRTVKRTVTALDQTNTDANANAGETETVESHTSAAAQVSASPGDGQFQQAENTPTRFKNRWRTTLRTVAAVDQTNTDTSSNASETETVETHTASAEEVEASAGDGQIQDAQNTPTRFMNRWRTVLRTRTAVDQTNTDMSVNAGETETVETHTAAPEEVEASPLDGQIQEAQNTPTPFMNRFRTVLRTRSATDQTTTDSFSTHAETLNIVTHTAAAAQATVGTLAAGTIEEVENTPTPFMARYHTVKRTRTSKELATEEHTSFSSNEEQRDTYSSENSVDFPECDNGGNPLVQKSCNVRKNNFGRFDYTFETTTEKAGFGGVSGAVTWTIKGESTTWRPAGSPAVIVTYYYHHTKQLHTTAAAAAAAITGGDIGSDWGRYSKGQWWSEKVIRNLTP